MPSAPTTTAAAREAPVNGATRAYKPAPTPTLPPVKTRRRPALIGLGLMLAAVGALAAGWLVTTVGQTEAVVVLVRPVQAGQVLQPQDLAVANVSQDPAVRTVPHTQMRSLVGQRATGALPVGALLTPDSVAPQLFPAAGQSVVGMALKPGQIPGEGLSPGDPVRVVTTPGDQADPANVKAGAAVSATVTSVRTDENTGQTVLNVSVPAAQAPTLAARVATGRIAVLLDSQER